MRSALFVLSAVVGSIITLVVANAAGYLRGVTPSPPEQMDAILEVAARQDLEPTYIRDVDLRGTGETVRLVVLRTAWTSGHTTRQSRPSDELRLYTLRGGHWELAYSARPKPLEGEIPYRIRLMGIGRFDSTDRQEAILRLDPEYADTELPRPVALVWSQTRQRYELYALLTQLPRLPRLHGAWAETTPHAVRPNDIPLAGGSKIPSAGSAPWIAIARSRLVAAYPIDKTCNGCTGIWELKMFCIDFQERGLGGQEMQYFSTTGKREDDIVRLAGHGEAVEPALNAALHRRDYCE